MLYINNILVFVIYQSILYTVSLKKFPAVFLWKVKRIYKKLHCFNDEENTVIYVIMLILLDSMICYLC